MRSGVKFGVIALGTVTVVLSGVGIASATGGSSTPAVKGKPGVISPDVVARPLQAQTVYKSIANCRIVNTGVAGGAIANGATRNFQVTGTSGFSAQGGDSCAIPTFATAVSASIAALAPKASGAFIAYPTGAPSSEGTLYYNKNVNIVTGQILKIGTGGKVTIKNVEGPANTVIDVNGYYAPVIDAFVGSDGSLFSASSQIDAASNTGDGSYTVTVDDNVEDCAVAVTPDLSGVYAEAFTDGSEVIVRTWVLSNTAAVTTINEAFNLIVSC